MKSINGLMLNHEKVETLTSTKLLGTIISDDLRWDLNTTNIVKKLMPVWNC